MDGRIKQVLYLCCFTKEVCRNKFLYLATVRSMELIIISQIKGKHALIILPTGYRKSLIYQAAPDIASELAAHGLVSGK